MSDQPKPTVNEWTVDGDFIRDGGSNLLLSLKAIADAHNAQIAAERAKVRVLADALKATQSQLRGGNNRHPLLPFIDEQLAKVGDEQLAAERERAKTLLELLTEIRRLNFSPWVNKQIDAALAQLKEKP